METYAPIVGMILVSIGSAMVLGGMGGLIYVLWPRSKNKGGLTRGHAG